MSEPERKVWSLSEAEASDAGSGGFSGYASVFGIRDLGGDVVAPGAFAATLPEYVRKGFIAWGHDWNNPVATIAEAREDAHGLFLKADFHSDPASQQARTRTVERIARGKPMGLSIGYQADLSEPVAGGRLLKQITLYETSLVTVPMLPAAGVTAVKDLEAKHASLSRQQRGRLHDAIGAVMDIHAAHCDGHDCPLGQADGGGHATSSFKPCGACAVGIPPAGQDDVAAYVATLAHGRKILQSVVPPIAVDVVGLHEAAAAAIDTPAAVSVVRHVAQAGQVARIRSVVVRPTGGVAEATAGGLVLPDREGGAAGVAHLFDPAALVAGPIDLLPATRAGAGTQAGDFQAVRLHGEALTALHTCKHAVSESAFAGHSIRDGDSKSPWTGRYVNDLPDSAFAYVGPGGSKDGEGKTVPRSLRHFPHHAQDGSVDLPHVRNALARIPQSDVPASAKESATAHVQRHLDASKGLDRGGAAPDSVGHGSNPKGAHAHPGEASAPELLDALDALLDAPAAVQHAQLANLARRARDLATRMEARAAPPPDSPAGLLAAFRRLETLHPSSAPGGPFDTRGGR